ncbi:hypothetical protein E0D81_21765 [Lelliottia amnigena]|uniref:hypothetical protein n=1 Tax=Lelliottia amnigena TaxID=61646 RepID=UPI00103A2211|nr:hypothetical protein [Lelliottia amnigena]TCD12264.1 hypothetical protein E0D81_21765 [Lelliottia amnigena]
MLITDGMIRAFIYIVATFIVVPLIITKSAWWVGVLLLIALVDLIYNLRQHKKVPADVSGQIKRR